MLDKSKNYENEHVTLHLRKKELIKQAICRRKSVVFVFHNKLTVENKQTNGQWFH